jgi:hypothetical protein
MKSVLLVLFALTLMVAACGGGESTSSAGAGDPVRVVEDYFSAKIQSDEPTIRRLLCAEMESVAEREIRSFDSVSNATLENMSCSFDEPASAVRCSGEIVALYGAEETRFPLTNYRVVQEDGEWKWCGEAP